jgi:hypothetical protein
MAENIGSKKDGYPISSEKSLILRYKGEDDTSFFVTSLNGFSIQIPKNRNAQNPVTDQSDRILIPAFRLLLLAFFGLAPAGLGTIVLAPLAALWALVIWVTQPLSHTGTLRVMLICGLAATLLSVAVPLSKLFLAHLS